MIAFALFYSVTRKAGNMSVALSLESTKEKILKGSDIKPAEVFMASGLGDLPTTAKSTLVTNCIFCHIFIFPWLRLSDLMLPYCLLSKVQGF